MDPMKFNRADDDDDDMMTAADWARLAPVWRGYLSTGKPGGVALFSYSMRRDERAHFLASAAEHLLPTVQPLRMGLLEVKNHTSDWHCAILLSSDESLLWSVRHRVCSLFSSRGRDRDDFPTALNVFEQAP